MNVTFTLLQGTGNGQEMRLDIYNPAHGVGATHEVAKKTAVRIVQPAADDTSSDRKLTETMVLMTKQEARAVASALMGAASEL
jgi:hypothetical protein